MPGADKHTVIRNCPVEDRCEKLWDDLAPTESDGIRYCDHCEKTVHLVHTEAELENAIREKLCIAWKTSDGLQNKSHPPEIVMGDPTGSMEIQKRILIRFEKEMMRGIKEKSDPRDDS